MALSRSWARLVAVALAFTLSLAGGPFAGEAHACSCALTPSTDEMFQRSDAVFSGEVARIGEQPVERSGPMDPSGPFLAPVTFDVKAAWKGMAGDSAVVYGQGPGVSCGLDFERGETYLVFAGRAGEGGDGPLQTDMCGPTRLSSVETARNMLGPPGDELPETGGVQLEIEAARWTGPKPAVAAVVLASVAAGAVFAGRISRGPGR